MKDTNKLKNTWKLNWYVLSLIEVFVNQKRINVCEYIAEIVHVTVSSKSHQGKKQEEGRSGADGGKIDISEVSTRAVSRW